jgi:Bacterial SH3 domain
MTRRGALALLLGVFAAGCGSATHATSTATPSATPSASATPQLVGTQRTVLAPLGLNIHADPSVSAAVIATAAQGTPLSVLDYRPDNGGWFKVMGETQTGWIVSDPTLTAPGQFTPYSSDTRMFSVLVPNTWTFAEEITDVLFRPQQGQQTIVVRTAATRSALGPETPPGYVSTFSQQQIVCGYTGQLIEYTRTSTAAQATPSPGGSTAMRLMHYADIRLTFDSSHAMEMAFNYASRDQLTDFQNFYDSITFPFSLCEAAPSPSPT